MVECLVPGDTLARQLAAQTQLGMQQAIFGARCEVQRGAFGAQAASVGRMRGVAAHADDALVLGFDQQPAADTAVTTGGFDLFDHGFLAPACAEQKPCHGGKSLIRGTAQVRWRCRRPVVVRRGC
jgi:hypothetical protein